MIDGLQQIGVHRAVRQAQLEAALARHAHHVRAVVAGPGHRVGRPGGARYRARRIDALVGVDGRVGDGGKRLGVAHDAAEEIVALLRQSHLVGAVEEHVGRAGLVPDRDVDVAAVAGETGERLGHERRAQAVLLGDRLDHELEERVPVGGDERVVEVPVHLELAVGVLVVVLVRAPAELQHVVADFGDDVVAAHQRLLVVAGLDGVILVVGDGGAVGH